jgi:hypothetical protein
MKFEVDPMAAFTSNKSDRVAAAALASESKIHVLPEYRSGRLDLAVVQIGIFEKCETAIRVT